MLKQTRLTCEEIKRNPSGDFMDDGTRFESYLFKDKIEITRASGTGSPNCFIAIQTYKILPGGSERTAELKDFEFKLANYFNYVPREMFDRTVLLNICHYFYEKYINHVETPECNLPIYLS